MDGEYQEREPTCIANRCVHSQIDFVQQTEIHTLSFV